MKPLPLFATLLISCTSHAQWSNKPDSAKSILLGSFFNSIVADGTGGAIIIGRKDGLFIAQKVDKDGYIAWDPSQEGMAVVIPDSANDVTIGRQAYLWPDGKGGVYVAYEYYDFIKILTNPEYVVIYDIDTYVQHLDDNGHRMWGNKGIALSALKGLTSDDLAQSIMVASGADGHNGLLAVYASGSHDAQGNAVGGIYVQRLDASGIRLWEENGRLILSDAAALNAIVDHDGSAFVITYRNIGTYSLAKISNEGQLLWERVLSISINDLIEGKILSDGTGGCYLIVPHERANIKAYRFHSNGNQSWGENGIFVTSDISRFDFIQDAINQNKNGFVCIWSEFRTDSTTRGHYAQYVDSSGLRTWGEKGLPISAVPTAKGRASLTLTSDDHFLFLFGDKRNNEYHSYAQKIATNGIAQWPTEDVLISSKTSGGSMITDDAGGAIIAWAEFSPRAVYVQKVDKDGNLGGIVSVKDPKDGTLPKYFDLYQNQPNPFTHQTIIHYTLKSGQHLVQLKIYNTRGEEVVTLVNTVQTEGTHAARWAGHDKRGKAVAGGIYFCRLQIGQFHQVKKLVVLR